MNDAVFKISDFVGGGYNDFGSSKADTELLEEAEEAKNLKQPHCGI